MAVIAEAVIQKGDAERIRQILEGAPAEYKKVLGGALHDVGKSTRTKIVRRIAKTIALKQKNIRRALTLRRNTSQASPIVAISIKGFRSGLKHFGRAAQRKKGVGYRIEKGEKRKIALGAFQIGKFSDNVFIRRGKSSLTDKRRVDRLPIDKLRGPSVPAVFQNRTDTIAQDTLNDASAQLVNRVQARMELVNRRIFKRVERRRAG